MEVERLMRMRRVQALLVPYPGTRKMLIVSGPVLGSARSPPVGSRKAHLDPVEPALRYGSPYGFPTLGLGADRAALGVSDRNCAHSLFVSIARRSISPPFIQRVITHSSLDGLLVR